MAWTLLALVAALFIAFERAMLPRLTNVHFGDIEFTGWSGPLGSRLLRGERPYVDFVLPIPPGSFVLLALIEKLAGRAILLQELWLNAAIHLAMGLVAYWIAAPLTSRKNAVLTAVATLVTVSELNKECAYDHTAQLVAWLSVAVGVRALLASAEARRCGFWAIAGALAGFTLAFKQSTGVGIIVGWGLAFAYLVGVELRSGHRERARALVRELLAYTQGVGLGVAALWLLLVLLGSTMRAYVQATFLDASTLKGGPRLLAENLAVYLFEYPAYPGSLAALVVLVLLGARLVRRRGSLHVGDELARRTHFRAWEAIAIAVPVTVAVAAALYFLARGPAGYPVTWVLTIDALRIVATVGLVAATTLFVAHLGATGSPATPFDLREDPATAGHGLNALIIAASACSLLHNTSAPEFRPFYDNNPIIPLTFLALFVVLDRADLRALSVGVLLLLLGGAAGNKYYRAMTATIPIGNEGYWSGMRVSDRGALIARVAERVRSLTRADDTVLVLPEDVQIATVIGRPRPPLIGAIVFVDQYAPRLASDDIDRLDEHPPKVVVLHPRQEAAWQRFFRIWSGSSGAERVLHHVVEKLLRKQYRRDSSYPTTFLWEPGTLDIYVRKEASEKSAPPGADLPGEVPETDAEPDAPLAPEPEQAPKDGPEASPTKESDVALSPERASDAGTRPPTLSAP